jgi:tight adherence protein B
MFDLLNKYVTSAFLVLLPIAGMMLIFYSAYQLWRDLRGAEKRKIRERLNEDAMQKKAKRFEQSIRKQDNIDSTLFVGLLKNISLTKKVDKWIEQADVDIVSTRFLLVVGMSALSIYVAGSFLKFSLAWVLGITAAVAYLPFWVLRFMANRRMKKLVNQLPDVFELIGQALRAGHSLASGIQLIGKQLPNPAGIEFSRIFHEQNLGIKIEEALSNFAERTDQLDIRFFVTAVLIQRQTGGDLAEILDKISEVIRDRIKIKGQVQALTAEGRMSGWVLSIMPFIVYVASYMLNPEYASVLIYDPKGQYMAYGALFSVVVGMLMIKKIVNIKI